MKEIRKMKNFKKFGQKFVNFFNFLENPLFRGHGQENIKKTHGLNRFKRGILWFKQQSDACSRLQEVLSCKRILLENKENFNNQPMQHVRRSRSSAGPFNSILDYLYSSSLYTSYIGHYVMGLVTPRFGPSVQSWAQI